MYNGCRRSSQCREWYDGRIATSISSASERTLDAKKKSASDVRGIINEGVEYCINLTAAARDKNKNKKRGNDVREHCPLQLHMPKRYKMH